MWKDPFYVIAVWKGGLAIHGAILGGLLIAVLYARKQKISKNQVHFPNACFFKNFLKKTL
jgi:prolipoprotein diacylglyceryltransferase